MPVKKKKNMKKKGYAKMMGGGVAGMKKKGFAKGGPVKKMVEARLGANRH